jgi:hypothetical protein
MWEEIIVREDTGENKFDALRELYAEFVRFRSERGVDLLLADFERLKNTHSIERGTRTCCLDPRVFGILLPNDLARELTHRLCWCCMPDEEREKWRPGMMCSLETLLAPRSG